MNQKIRKIIIVLIMLFISFPAYAELILARAPQLSATVTAKIWTPFVDYLVNETGEKIKLKIYSDRILFEEDIVSGYADIFFGNPAYAVVAKLKHGYEPLVRSDKKRLQGIIVVKDDSPIKTVQDLKKHLIVFPSRTAFAASLYIRNQLDNVIGVPYEEAYISTHDNVYRGVFIGKFPAGGGVKTTLEREPEEIKTQLRIVYETPEVKPHPLSVHPRVPAQLSLAILNATIQLNDSASGRKLLNKLKLKKPVKADYNRDYKSLEGLAKKVYDYLL